MIGSKSSAPLKSQKKTAMYRSNSCAVHLCLPLLHSRHYIIHSQALQRNRSVNGQLTCLELTLPDPCSDLPRTGRLDDTTSLQLQPKVFCWQRNTRFQRSAHLTNLEFLMVVSSNKQSEVIPMHSSLFKGELICTTAWSSRMTGK